MPWQSRNKLMSEIPGQSEHALPGLQPPFSCMSRIPSGADFARRRLPIRGVRSLVATGGKPDITQNVQFGRD
jgi:hypothetical protein